MPRLRLLILLTLLGFAPITHAAPTMSFTWDGCEGPLQRTPKGPGVYSLFVTATGVDQVHWAYEAQIQYATADSAVPDAWRFDQGGCRGTASARFHKAPASKEAAACPSFYGDQEAMFIHAIRPRNSEDLPEIREGSNLIVLAVAYRKPVTPDPNRRYFLFRIDFDHASGDCKGLDQGIAFLPVRSRCNFLIKDENGERHDVAFEAPQEPLVFGNVPKGTKWGQIRTQAGLPR